ncbi:myosin light chain kinase A-like, partial [Condylostylus longicornis]|uniref:myosin light chain kinase A-like n=1 Tax=Condylostylus longicornis TaxID=2530218 RepID=UPI00244DDE75
MGNCCKSSTGASKSSVQSDGGIAATQQQQLEKQGQILKPMKGSRLGSARIRRGNIFDFYSFESKILGTGFSGPVRLAVDRKSGRKYAVKPFSKTGANKDKVNMLRNEASIYLRLDHPNIARLVEIWEGAHQVHLIMEYCSGRIVDFSVFKKENFSFPSGGELYERLCARKVYSESAARHTANQMFSAICYLHGHKVVHRDLKLENWLYDTTSENSSLKLIDFGFAKIWDPKQPKRMHATCGTLAYVSPDTLLGGYTSACDLWSLGVIVYTLLVGYPPFYGAEEEMFSRILEAQYSLSGSRCVRITSPIDEFLSLFCPCYVQMGSSQSTCERVCTSIVGEGRDEANDSSRSARTRYRGLSSSPPLAPALDSGVVE